MIIYTVYIIIQDIQEKISNLPRSKTWTKTKRKQRNMLAINYINYSLAI